MLDAKKILNDFLNSGVPGTRGSVRETAGKAGQMAKDNPLATGALAAVLLGTGFGRDITKSAVKLGGAAAIAGLAYTAYRNYQDGKAPATTAENAPEVLPAPEGSAFDIEAVSKTDEAFPAVLVKAMIAAARADGHVDDAERSRIAERMQLSGIEDDVQSFMRAELAKPVDIDALVSKARTEEQRIELYTASRLAIEPRTRAERGYLDMLAGRLSLPDALVDHIEATVANATA